MQGVENRQQVKDIPVLFLSATNNENLINSALEAGGTKFISKPIQLNLLINLVVEMSHTQH